MFVMILNRINAQKLPSQINLQTYYVSFGSFSKAENLEEHVFSCPLFLRLGEVLVVDISGSLVPLETGISCSAILSLLSEKTM